MARGYAPTELAHGGWSRRDTSNINYWSQDAPPVRVRGTIERIESPVFLVKSRDGAELKIVLADNAVAVGVVKATLADIKPGSFVGIGAMPQADGTQRALEVLIFPDAMRGTGEGHYPWDLQPKSTSFR